MRAAYPALRTGPRATSYRIRRTQGGRRFYAASVLDAANRVLVKGLQALMAVDRWAVDAVGRGVGDRVLPAVDRAVRRGLSRRGKRR